MESHDPKIQQLKDISVLMDSKFTGPFGIKFGLDGLLGLIPIIGDFTGALVSLYIIFHAALMGCSPSVLFRMGLNVLIENLVDMIPLAGNIFDFVWKANIKNIFLLETHLLNPNKVTTQSRLILSLICFMLLLILVGSITLTVYFIKFIFQWIGLFSS